MQKSQDSFIPAFSRKSVYPGSDREERSPLTKFENSTLDGKSCSSDEGSHPSRGSPHDIADDRGSHPGITVIGRSHSGAVDDEGRIRWDDVTGRGVGPEEHKSTRAAEEQVAESAQADG